MVGGSQEGGRGYLRIDMVAAFECVKMESGVARRKTSALLERNTFQVLPANVISLHVAHWYHSPPNIYSIFLDGWKGIIPISRTALATSPLLEEVTYLEPQSPTNSMPS